ncbi:MAG: hypothetical protein JW757_12995 [Anaerolineales bacterium]|nr:hypothetical protein [Anaerolineales bacterium]
MKSGILKASICIVVIILLVSCGSQSEPPPEALEPEPLKAEQAVIFFADRGDLAAGECTFIRWEVVGSYMIVINNQEVPPAGEQEVCPTETQVFILWVDFGDRLEERVVEIFVQGDGPSENGLREAEPTGGEPAGPREVSERPEIEPGTPAYLTGIWQRTSGPPGGLGYDIRMDPRNPDEMYVTDAWAGVFKSTDGGASWVPINNGITARVGLSGDGIPVFSLTIDPNNPETLWVGTQFGGGVFRSDDAGASWRSMSNGIVERGLTIRGFGVEPGNSDVVYLAGEISSWEWNNEVALPGLGLDMTKGAVYKTTDGGKNWNRIWYGDNLARYIWIHPEDHNLIYVSTGIFDREAANSDPVTLYPGGVGILRSRDGGNTWEELGADNGIREEELYFGSLFMHPENPDVLIAASGNDPYLSALQEPLGAIYLTKDGGDHWQRVLPLNNASTVEICTSDPNVVYAGSINGIYRSDDGGHTWMETSGVLWGSEDTVAGFPIDMQCDLRDPMRIFINNYIGGNFLSEDGGYTWKLSSKGYTGALVKQVDVSWMDPAHVYSASRMGIFVSHDGGDNWTGTAHGMARSPEGFVVAVDPFDDRHIMAVIGDAGPDPWVSWDEGQTWIHVPTGFEGEEGRQIGAIIDIIFSPDNPNLVLAIAGNITCPTAPDACIAGNGDGIILSTDRGITWTRTSLQNEMVMDLKFVTESLIYAAVYPDTIYKSTDAGQSWEVIASGIMPTINLYLDDDPDLAKEYTILSIGYDPNQPQKIFAGFKYGGLKVSIDGGESWEIVATGLLPEISVDDIIADPVHPGIFYLGSSNMGIFYSIDSGATWTELNDGLTNRYVVDLALSADGSVLYMASEGGGVFQLGYQGE